MDESFRQGHIASRIAPFVYCVATCDVRCAMDSRHLYTYSWFQIEDQRATPIASTSSKIHGPSEYVERRTVTYKYVCTMCQCAAVRPAFCARPLSMQQARFDASNIRSELTIIESM